MGRSNIVSEFDRRAVYLLVGECLSLGADPGRWEPHLFRGLATLIGATTISGGEGVWPQHARLPQPTTVFEAGFESDQLDRFAEYMKNHGPLSNPLFRRLARRRIGMVTTRDRQQLMSDRTWYRSASYLDGWAAVRIDHTIVSVADRADGRVHAILAHRPIGARPLREREWAMLDLLHNEVASRFGRGLTTATRTRAAISLSHLQKAAPPYSLVDFAMTEDFTRVSGKMRAVLDRLLEGRCDKEIAQLLGVKSTTISEHVGKLLFAYGVETRTELMALLLTPVNLGLQHSMPVQSPR